MMTERCKPYVKKIEYLKREKLDLLKSNAQLRDENKNLKAFKQKTFELIQSFKERDLLDVERILIDNFEKELQE